MCVHVCVSVFVCVCMCVSVHARVFNTDQCRTHLNSVCACVCGEGGGSFCMALCVGCFGGTALRVYRISYLG